LGHETSAEPSSAEAIEHADDGVVGVAGELEQAAERALARRAHNRLDVATWGCLLKGRVLSCFPLTGVRRWRSSSPYIVCRLARQHKSTL